MEDRTAAPESPMPVSAVTAIEVEPVGAGVVTVGVGVGVAVGVGVLVAVGVGVAVGVTVGSGVAVGSGVGAVRSTIRIRMASIRRLLPVVPQVPPSRVHASHPRSCTWHWYSITNRSAATGSSRACTASIRSERPVVPANSSYPTTAHGIQPMFCMCARYVTGQPLIFRASMRNDLPVVPAVAPSETEACQPMFCTCAE